MSIATVSQTIALQHEYLAPKLNNLTLSASKLWGRIKVRTDIKAVSNRPARVAFETLTGGKFRVFNPDGGDMGQGSGSTMAYGTISNSYYLLACQYTALTEYSTDTDTKAIENYATKQLQDSTKWLGGYFDALIQQDGSNTLNTVVSVTGTQVVVQNANAFQDNQDIDWFSSLTGIGAYLGSSTILSIDSGSNSIWLTAAPPGAVGAGTLALVSGSAGLANTGYFGLRAFQVNGNAGSYLGIQKNAAPGKFSTPYINALSLALTAARARALKAQIELAVGIERANKPDFVAHMNVDSVAAWENIGLTVSRNIWNEQKGNETLDMQKRNSVGTFMEYEILKNERAAPQIIDLLNLPEWSRIEGKPVDYYEVGGQTMFTAYGASGGTAASTMFYLVHGGNLFNEQPRESAYMNNLPTQAGYFGN